MLWWASESRYSPLAASEGNSGMLDVRCWQILFQPVNSWKWWNLQILFYTSKVTFLKHSNVTCIKDIHIIKLKCISLLNIHIQSSDKRVTHTCLAHCNLFSGFTRQQLKRIENIDISLSYNEQECRDSLFFIVYLLCM